MVVIVASSAILLGLAIFLRSFVELDPEVYGNDFVVFWVAARVVFEADVLDLLDVERFAEHLRNVGLSDVHWLYPPHAIAVFLPFGPLPFGTAYLAWSAIGLAVYALAINAHGGNRWSTLASVAAPAALLNLLFGQTGFLSTALLVAGLRLAGARPIVSGVLFGLLSYKPQLGLVVPFALLARRQWVEIAAAVVTVAGLVLCSILMFGTEVWERYFHHLSTLSEAPLYNLHSAEVFVGARVAGLGTTSALALQIVVSVATIASAYWALRRVTSERVRLAVVLVGTLLASPHTLAYDMVLAAAGVIYMTREGLERGFLPGERVALALLWFVPLVIGAAQAHHVPLGAASVALMYVLLLARVAKGRA